VNERPQCNGITNAGRRCTARALPGQQWCHNHSPGRADQRKRNAKAGGRARARRQPSEIEDIRRRIEAATSAVLRGKLDRAIAVAAFQGFHCLLRAVELERRVREADELEGRISMLEARVRRSGWEDGTYKSG
jgi:hypothetical protein